MENIAIQASLKSAKLTARKNPDHPDTVIRRVQFSLTKTFGHEEAEFLGQVGIELLRNLQGRVLNKGEILIDAFHAKAEFVGSRGTATADIDGLVAKAAVVGNEDQEHEEITFDFEAPCEAGLLVFFGLSLKEFIDVDIKGTQQELNLDPVRDAVKAMAASLPKGTSMTMSFDGEAGATLEGTGPVRE
jgi:hypothetical protein